MYLAVVVGIPFVDRLIIPNPEQIWRYTVQFLESVVLTIRRERDIFVLTTLTKVQIEASPRHVTVKREPFESPSRAER
ncbi:hypothetical protein EVAR_48285_1 [Eumeta japonica]|uniref:Uncharacterized protein n=1 Tax=Eumeta variegata TaxID=151549 RepID=A0A4C1WME8_EUMVA|nr:hypothetical protein EVAR_48285_1 [Eumeta japonica]